MNIDIKLHKNDLPEDLDLGNTIAIDGEFMGLNVSRDPLCVLQISSGKIQDFGPQRIAALARMRLGNNYRTYDFNQLRRVICTLVYKLPPDLFHTIERFVEGRFGKRQPRIHPR